MTSLYHLVEAERLDRRILTCILIGSDPPGWTSLHQRWARWAALRAFYGELPDKVEMLLLDTGFERPR